MDPGLAQLEQIVLGNLASENAVRKTAEQAFEECKRDMPSLFVGLVRIVQGSAHVQARQFCAVMLRQFVQPRVVDPDTPVPWQLLNAETRERVKAVLLELLEKESVGAVRRRITDVIGVLAALILTSEQNNFGTWPEVVPILLRVASSPVPMYRESALDIFARMAEWTMEPMRENFGLFREILVKSIMDPSSAAVRLSATKTLLSLLLRERSKKNPFMECIPLIFQSLGVAYAEKDEDCLEESLEAIAEPTEYMDTFWRPHIQNIASVLLQIATTPRTPEGLSGTAQRSAFSFLLALAKRLKKAFRTQTMRPTCEAMTRVGFELMARHEQSDTEWSGGHDEDHLEEEDLGLGIDSIDMLAKGFGGKIFRPIALPLVTGLCGSPDWQARYAAAISLGEMSEAMAAAKLPLKEVEADLRILIEFASKDPNPRVRWAAFNSLAQFCTDYAPDLQDAYHSQIMPVLITSMDPANNHRRVARHAALCVVDFCAGIEKEALAQYSDAIMTTVLKTLKIQDMQLQEGALAVLAALTAAAKEHFVKYFDTAVPILVNIMTQTRGHRDLRDLRSRAIECLGLAAVSVGKERFAPFLRPTMELVIATFDELDADDPQFTQIAGCWSHICEAVRLDFVPYLKLIIPKLMTIVKYDKACYVVEKETNADNLPEGYEVQVLDIRTVGTRSIVYHPAMLEDKADATKCLYHLCSYLQDHFYPFIEESMRALIPLMGYLFHETIRLSAVEAVPILFASAASAAKSQLSVDGLPPLTTAYVQRLFDELFPEFMSSMHVIADLELLASTIDSFATVIHHAPQPLSAEQLEEVVDAALSTLQESTVRRRERDGELREADDPEAKEILEEENAEDDAICASVHYVLRECMRLNKASMFPLFNAKLHPVMSALLAPNLSAGEHCLGLSQYVEVIDHCGPQALVYLKDLLNFFMLYSQDRDADVRQAALYGLGHVAQYGGPAFVQIAQPVIERCVAAIQAPDSRSSENGGATDNAISTIARIAIHHPTLPATPELLRLMVQSLPLTEDNEEACKIHDLLCTLIEQGNQHVLGANFANLPKIVQVIADIVDTELVTETTRQRLLGIWAQLQRTVPPQPFQQLWAMLSEEQRASLTPHLLNRPA